MIRLILITNCLEPLARILCIDLPLPVPDMHTDPTNRCDCRQSVDTIRLLLKILILIPACTLLEPCKVRVVLGRVLGRVDLHASVSGCKLVT